MNQPLNPFDLHPVKNDGRWKRVHRGIKNLCTNGVAPWWIKEKTPSLLQFEVVKQAAQRVVTDDDKAEHGLAAVLREAVTTFDGDPHGRLLWIVLGLHEGPYIDVVGNKHDLLEMNATMRRILAGREFRGGSKPVGGNGIRLYHEPPAVIRLGVALLRREVAITGLLLDDGGYSKEAGERALLYLPGEAVPEAGQYDACAADGDPLNRQTTCFAGDRFPPMREDTPEYAWRLAAEA